MCASPAPLNTVYYASEFSQHPQRGSHANMQA